MNHVIIGTAGHVDHGKTSLIKALTGIDTDRLKEEKKRGITIELGFAHLNYPDGRKIGIVDVPGHEKFVKNMLAGSGGIDIALLAIAANEGVMPQTREHFEILKLLNIKTGIIVITKTDMVDKPWLDMVQEDVKALVKGSFLADAAIALTSVYNNTGIEELKALIFNLAENVYNQDTKKAFRLPVDRIFSVDGFGTVVTGTLIEGSVKKGDMVKIYPTLTETKIRNIQVHDNNEEEAYMGQRVAINLASVKKEEVKRGYVLAKPDTMENTYMVDGCLTLLKDTERTVKNNSRVHFYHGSSEVLAKVILLDRDVLKPGESCYVQLRLEEEIAVKYGDRYIIRFYSPMETIGGGMIINPNPVKHQRNNGELIKSLNTLENGTVEERTEEFINEMSWQFPRAEKISVRANISLDEFNKALSTLEKAGKTIRLEEDIVISSAHFKAMREKSEKALKDYHEDNKFKKGMNIEEYKSKVFSGVNEGIAGCIISCFAEKKVINIGEGLVWARDFKVQFDDSHSKVSAEIEKIYLEAGFIVPNKEDVLLKVKDKNKNKIFSSMIENGMLIMVDKQLCFHKKTYEKALSILVAYIESKGAITLGEFRDLIGASRKYAMALLEHFDSKKITKKVEDKRVLIKK